MQDRAYHCPVGSIRPFFLSSKVQVNLIHLNKGWDILRTSFDLWPVVRRTNSTRGLPIGFDLFIKDSDENDISYLIILLKQMFWNLVEHSASALLPTFGPEIYERRFFLPLLRKGVVDFEMAFIIKPYQCFFVLEMTFFYHSCKGNPFLKCVVSIVALHVRAKGGGG